jgi:hypothetical protein
LWDLDWCQRLQASAIDAQMAGGYTKVACELLVGMFVVVYAKKSVAPITNIRTISVATGFMGKCRHLASIFVSLHSLVLTLVFFGGFTLAIFGAHTCIL